MENNLSTTFSKILRYSHSILERVQLYTQPLAILFRTSLKEQALALNNLLLAFSKDKNGLEDIKIDCAVLYHANEVAVTHFNDWERSVFWMGCYQVTDEKAFVSLNDEINNMQNLLIDAAIKMKQQYGESNVKYFIPTFYRSK